MGISNLEQAFDVRIRIISQKGFCVIGHKLGDTFYIRNVTSPGGICMGAYATIHPMAMILAMGGGFPWKDEEAQRTICVVCQDPENPVEFELTRIPIGTD